MAKRTNNKSLQDKFGSRFSLSDLLLRAGLLALLWWILNDRDIASWTLGAPAVLLATIISVALLPRSRWRIKPFGFIRFVFYFLYKSLLSGVDVASRVLRPQIPLQPALIRYPIRLRHELGQVIMANVTSLLPGTLSAELKEDELIVHVLDERDEVMAELNRLERRIAAAYGVELGEATE